MDLDEYRLDLLQEVSAGSIVNSDFSRSEFVNTVMKELIDSEEISDYTPCYYNGLIGSHGKRIEFDGYDYEDFFNTFTLVVCKFDGTANPKSKLTKTEIDEMIKRARAFIEGSFDSTVQNSIDESEYAYELAEHLKSKREQIQRFRIIIVSDLQKSDKIKTIETENIDSKSVIMKLWDITNLYDLDISKKGFDDIEIDLSKFGVKSIPCIQTCRRSDGLDYEAYMCAIPGKLLSDLYDKYGSRLMESNVRSFLKMSTKTNKGMRNTIANEPEMFFAYNNGITTTATDIKMNNENGSMNITGFTALQIVNGGQTTVTIHTMEHQHHADISKTYVPMKLSVVSREIAEEIVPKISRYANTQNPVSESDFFSNNIFHKDIQELSRKIRVPQVPGIPYSTHWYYERVRGQYQQELSNKTKSEANKFKLENPKKQMFTKNDLAKFRNSYDCKPDAVSKGAQYSLIEFGKGIDEEHREKFNNDLYFQETVALGIIFRRVQELVSEQPWYEGGYRAQIVTYTISKFSDMINSLSGKLDLMKIWEMQSVPEEIERQLIVIMECVNKSINEDKEEANIGQWCKKPKCWQIIKKIEIEMNPDIGKFLISDKKDRWKNKTAARDTREKMQRNALINVVNLGGRFWEKTLEWGTENETLDGFEKDTLRIVARTETKLPTERQAEKAMRILERLRKEGYTK